MDTNATDSDNTNVQRRVALCLFATTSFLGTAGNILVVVAAALSQQLQTSTNICVIALSITDLMTCLLLPVQIISILGISGSVTFDWICSVIAVCSHIFFGISITILTLIAYDRFFLITRPRIDYIRLFTKRNIAITLVTVGGIISVVTVAFSATGQATFGSDEGICTHAKGASFAYLSGVWLLLCCIVIVVCYVKIYRHVKNQLRSIDARKDKSNRGSVPTDASRTDTPQVILQSTDSAGEPRLVNASFVKRQREFEFKITTNMLIIVVIFFLCNSPALFTLIIPGDQQASAIVMAMIALNSCLNPFVYAWKHPVFSHVFKCILKRRLSNIKEPTQFARYLLGLRPRSNGTRVIV